MYVDTTEKNAMAFTLPFTLIVPVAHDSRPP